MLTRSGLGALVAVVVIVVLGALWNYEEFVLAALAIGLLIGCALWVARRPLRATLQRTVDTVRVQRGDPIRVTYWIHNATRRTSGRVTLVDSCDGTVVETAVEPVAPDRIADVHAAIPTRRRGIFPIGPLETRRLDPLGLAVGRWRDARDVATPTPITVHPKVYALVGPYGAMRSVESEAAVRRATADPMSGFVSMREYVPGDDTRLIHWPTTARTGTPMVREHVEIRRPEFTIVLDTAVDVGSDDDFEEAVDVVATCAVHALRTGLDVVVRTTARDRPGLPTPFTDERQVVDFLTPVQRSPAGDLMQLPSLFMSGFDHTAIIVVTGPQGPSSRVLATEQMTTVRIGRDAQIGSGASFAAVDAADFAHRWRSWR